MQLIFNEAITHRSSATAAKDKYKRADNSQRKAKKRARERNKTFWDALKTREHTHTHACTHAYTRV